MAESPPEIWEMILGHLHSNKDLKATSLVCYEFQQITRNLLWNKPLFKQKCGLNSQELEQIAAFQPPIKVMTLSQVFCYRDLHPWAWRFAVEMSPFEVLRNKFNLQSFSLVNKSECIILGAQKLNLPQCREICTKLPVREIDTNDFNLHHAENEEVVEFLTEIKKSCQKMSIGGLLHDNLEAEDWREMVDLPIISITAYKEPFRNLKHYEDYEMDEEDERYFKEYCKLVSSIKSKPTYHLEVRDVTIKQLQAMKDIQIAEIRVSILYDFETHFEKFIEALKSFSHKTELVIDPYGMEMGQFKELMGLDMTVRYIRAVYMNIDENNAEMFVEIIEGRPNKVPLEICFKAYKNKHVMNEERMKRLQNSMATNIYTM